MGTPILEAPLRRLARNASIIENLSALIPWENLRIMVAVHGALAKQSLADRRSQAELGNESKIGISRHALASGSRQKRNRELTLNGIYVGYQPPSASSRFHVFHGNRTLARAG